MLRGECLPKLRTSYFLDSSVCYMDKHWPASKLSGALWRRGEKRKESLQLLLWNLNSASNSHVAPRRLSEAERGNERECKQTLKRHAPRVMTSFLMSSPHFSMQIFKFQRRSCKLSFLFPPRRQGAPESFSQARETFDSAVYLLCFFEGSNKVFTNDFFDIFVRVTSLEKLSNEIGKCCYITQALG